jgi:hypothetical protein
MEKGLSFSVPFNGDINVLDEFAALKGARGNRIDEVYLSGPQELLVGQSSACRQFSPIFFYH